MQTQPVEDIEAVLGRFQAWTGSRNAIEAKPGIRELSYEEAVQSRRYRRNAADEAPSQKSLGPEPGVIPVAPPDGVREPARRKANSAEAGNAKRQAGNGRKACLRNQDAKPAAPVAAVAPAAKTRARATFHDVLAETVRPAEAIVAAQPMELTRHIAISVRLAPQERALIKTRAAEAGVTVSAYIRQCTLEVEQLRTQVQQTLATMERTVPMPAHASLQKPGFFARLVRRFFSGSASVLALRV